MEYYEILRFIISRILPSIMLVVVIAWTAKLLNWVWFGPKKLEKFLREQGLNGNPYRLVIGDLKELISVVQEEKTRPIRFSDDVDLVQHIYPYYHQTTAKYGVNSFVWFGPMPRLIVSDRQLIKEALTKINEFHKPHPDPIGEIIVGGLLYLEDEIWAKRRKIIGSAFHLDKLKHMTPAMKSSCSKMIEKWESLLVCSGDKLWGELDVWPHLKDLTGDVISRTLFGSNYERGRRIFQLQNEQMELVLPLMAFTFIRGWRYIPIRATRRLKVITREIQSLLKDIINEREKAMERGETMTNDLLSILLESNLKEIQELGNKNSGMSTNDVIEECKLFYFAGSETTANLLVWTMVMLSKHQEWQVRAREEVLQVFGKNEPTYEGLSRLKNVTMILQEILRLYPPVPLLVRSPTKTVKLGNLTLPKGAELLLQIGQLHYDPKIWGEDAKEFKPERFSEGMTRATKDAQFAFIPFSLGPRICVGQNFSMIEAKMAMVMILQHFIFELSPAYVHAPFAIFTLQPQHGVPLILKKL